MTPMVGTRLERQRDSVNARLHQLRDSLKAAEAELERAVAHEQRMFARLERRRSYANDENWQDAWRARARCEDDTRRLNAQVKALEKQAEELAA